MSPDAIVLDADQRSALAIVRSLGSRGLKVWATAGRQGPLAGASRWCPKTVLIPDPKHCARSFVEAVLDLIVAHPKAIVFPVTDASITALTAHPGIPYERIACAPAGAYDTLSDKASLVELARKIGVRVPPTRIASGRNDLERTITAAEEPVVLKPARSWYLHAGALHNTSVFIAQTRAAARAYAEKQAWVDHVPCLVQRYVEGSGAGIFTFYAEDKPLTWFSHRRLREKPPSGGVSVLSESSPVDARLQAMSSGLFDAANWFGPAMAEFRIAPNGESYLMEVNGRFWGSLQLAIDSGVDFPWMLYQSMTGQSVEPISAYTSGRRLRWLLGDFDSLLLTLRQPERSMRSKLESLARFATLFSRSTRFEVLRWSDPRPFFREAKLWIKALR